MTHSIEIIENNYNKKRNNNDIIDNNADNHPKFPIEPFRRISKACLTCRRDHLSCNNERPCNRCLCKGRECLEAESRPRGPKRKRGIIDSNSFPSVESSSTSFQSFHSLESINVDESVWEDFEKQYSLDGEWLSFLDQYQNGEEVNEDGEEEETSPLDLAIPEDHLLRELDSKIGTKVSKELCLRINSRLSKVKDFANNSQKRQLRLMFEKDLEEMKCSSSKMPIPVVLFGRGARILFYNDAFKDATGFEFELPTPLEDFQFMRIVDDQTLNDLYQSNLVPRLYLSDFKSMPMRLGFNCPKGNVEGNGMITALKHIMGFPHLFVCYFIPNSK
eukprot:TRINITY_DN1448_c0_g1_i1.p1 TRINITY_DN1448_c0_g1~~TRINITY_DN1448_c0_g1_i1.p1  ORF type:complete len:332 (+),score=79.02 TRINITY_DN1448_c0_g1_i1:130-1125(+)